MIKLLKIEWLKLRHFKAFWILLISYAVVTILVGSSGMWILNFLKNQGAVFNSITPDIIPLYDFPDVWQNVASVLGYLKVILAFIMVITVSNEFNYRIVRQNVIDGLSKKEWMGSKILTMLCLSAAATLLVFLIGLVNGLIYAHPHSYASMFENMDILLGYFLEIFAYLSFATFVTLLIRKPGIVIISLLIYTLMFEPFLTFFLYDYPDLAEHWRIIAGLFPVRSMMNLVQMPFLRYAFYEVQNFITFKEVFIVLVWVGIFLGGSNWILQRKDL